MWEADKGWRGAVTARMDATEQYDPKATNMAHFRAHRGNSKVKRVKVNSPAEALLSHDEKEISIQKLIMKHSKEQGLGFKTVAD